MAAPIPLRPDTSHPIDDAGVRREIAALTARLLALTGGTGKVTVEFDFKNWKALSYVARIDTPRKRLDT